MDYLTFLQSKEFRAADAGFEAKNLNPHLFEYERDVTLWALRKGKAALFEDCGLGKTIQQLAWAEKVAEHTGKSVLIVAPLSVAHQTVKEAEKFGIRAAYATDGYDCSTVGIYTTNYERIEKFDAGEFAGVVLDESSILKDYTSSTKQMLVEKFRETPYKLCCTATPSPNDWMELGNHAEFLGVMTRTEMLATYFVHDGGDTSKWRLKGHAQEAFFRWVASWACCMTKPSDLGYEMLGFDLPELRIHEIICKSREIEDEDGQVRMLPQTAMSLNERRKARRDSLNDRVMAAAEIANREESQCLIWCDLNAESGMLAASIRGAKEVKGADSTDYKVDTMNDFTAGALKCLVSKPSIAGWGMNWQQCNRMIFVGLSDSFEAYYQAVRRCWRYGQKQPVDVYIIISDTEGAVKANIERKQADAIRLTGELVKYTRDILQTDIRRTIRITESYITGKRMEMQRMQGPVYVRFMLG
ncbi:MAG: SNF2-related protein [Candidatus Merdivicinus sp.]|jgi:hypothetical protein